MTLHRIACCAALALGLTQMAAPASACEGTDCAPAAAAKPSKPLQLGKFMRPGGGKSAAVHAAKAPAKVTKPSVHVAKVAKKTAAPSIPLPPAPPVSESLAAEAASAFASLPATDVRVVDSSELNEIDLAAGPALPETNGAGQSIQDAVQATETTASTVAGLKSEDLQRSGEKLRMAALESAPSALPESPARAARTSLPWIERFWSAMQNTFVALAAGWHYLFG
jgi:hypothetical protein